MAKLFGENKLNTAVFISGRGSNLNSLINFSKKKYCPIKIKLVITNNKEAVGLKFAKKNKIKSLVVKYTTKLKAERKRVLLKDPSVLNIDKAPFDRTEFAAPLPPPELEI